jgi:hypothetical protein
MSLAPDWLPGRQGMDFAAEEAQMLAETDRGEGYFPDCERRAAFYENWGDSLAEGEEKIAKYREARNYWQMNASQATSGGEGTARMMDVHRVEKKIERLNK